MCLPKHARSLGALQISAPCHAVLCTRISLCMHAHCNSILHLQILVIKRMLTTTIAESTPESEETRRALGFFVNRCAFAWAHMSCMAVWRYYVWQCGLAVYVSVALSCMAVWPCHAWGCGLVMYGSVALSCMAVWLCGCIPALPCFGMLP